MTRKLVDIDEDRLARARELLGATTMKQTVNESLEEVIRLARRAYAQRLATMEGLDLDDEDVMAGAWR